MPDMSSSSILPGKGKIAGSLHTLSWLKSLLVKASQNLVDWIHCPKEIILPNFSLKNQVEHNETHKELPSPSHFQIARTKTFPQIIPTTSTSIVKYPDVLITECNFSRSSWYKAEILSISFYEERKRKNNVNSLPKVTWKSQWQPRKGTV